MERKRALLCSGGKLGSRRGGGGIPCRGAIEWGGDRGLPTQWGRVVCTLTPLPGPLNLHESEWAHPVLDWPFWRSQFAFVLIKGYSDFKQNCRSRVGAEAEMLLPTCGLFFTSWWTWQNLPFYRWKSRVILYFRSLIWTENKTVQTLLQCFLGPLLGCTTQGGRWADWGTGGPRSQPGLPSLYFALLPLERGLPVRRVEWSSRTDPSASCNLGFVCPDQEEVTLLSMSRCPGTTTLPSKCRTHLVREEGRLTGPFQLCFRFAVSHRQAPFKEPAFNKRTQRAMASSHMEVTFVITTHSPHPTGLMKTYQDSLLVPIWRAYFGLQQRIAYSSGYISYCHVPSCSGLLALVTNCWGKCKWLRRKKFSNSSIYSLKWIQWSVLQFHLPWV